MVLRLLTESDLAPTTLTTTTSRVAINETFIEYSMAVAPRSLSFISGMRLTEEHQILRSRSCISAPCPSVLVSTRIEARGTPLKVTISVGLVPLGLSVGQLGRLLHTQ